MSRRKCFGSLIVAGNHDAMSAPRIGLGLDDPFVAFTIQRVVQLHPGVAVLDAKFDGRSRSIPLERHRQNVHVHGGHIQSSLRLTRANVFDHGLANRFLIFDVLSRTGRQKQRCRNQRDSFHSTDYTCPSRFAVALPYDGAL